MSTHSRYSQTSVWPGMQLVGASAFFFGSSCFHFISCLVQNHPFYTQAIKVLDPYTAFHQSRTPITVNTTLTSSRVPVSPADLTTPPPLYPPAGTRHKSELPSFRTYRSAPSTSYTSPLHPHCQSQSNGIPVASVASVWATIALATGSGVSQSTGS